MIKLFKNKKAFAVLIIGFAFLITALAIFYAGNADFSKNEYVGRHQYQLLSSNEETQIAQNYINTASKYSANLASEDLFKLAGIFQEESETGEAISPPCGRYQYLSYTSPKLNCTPDYWSSYQAFFQNFMSTYLRKYPSIPLLFSFSLGKTDISNDKVRLLAKSSKEFKVPIGQNFKKTDYTTVEGILGGYTDEKIVPCTTGACVIEVADYYRNLYEDAEFPYVWGGETPYPVEDTIKLSKTPGSFFYGTSVTKLKPGTTQPTVPGFDCSGWTWWIGKHSGMKEFQIRKTAQKYYEDAKSKATEICSYNKDVCLASTIFEKAQAGDVLFLGTPSKIDHIMFYAGNGEISHSRGGKGITREPLPTTYATDKSTKIVGVYRFKYLDKGVKSLEQFDPYSKEDNKNPLFQSPKENTKINNKNQDTTKSNNENKDTVNSNLAGPTAWCDGTESLPKGTYADRIGKEAWNSQGKNYFDIAVQAGLEKGVDPALITTHMIYETSMGLNDKCISKGKSSLTGCTWYTSCSKECSCGGTATLSDQNQLSCTARADRIAFDEASTGVDSGTGNYEKCNAYVDNPDKMWTCMLCIYQGDYDHIVDGSSGKKYFTRDGTCKYAENFKKTYCSWRKYFEQKGYDAATYSGPTSVSNSYLTFTPYIDTTINMNFDDLEKVSKFVKDLQKNCVDNLRVCVPKQIKLFNSQNPKITISMDAEKDALARDVIDQLLDCYNNEQNQCICPLSINLSLNSDNKDNFEIILNKDKSVNFENKKITTLPFNPTKAITKKEENHDYVKFSINKKDLSDNKFKAEDWFSDYSWNLGLDGSSKTNIALLKSSDLEYSWIKYPEKEKSSLQECRNNKKYFRLQSHFSFTPKTLDFSMYLEDTTAPAIVASEPKQISCAGNPALELSWFVPKNTDPAYDFIIKFQGGEESYQAIEANSEDKNSASSLSSYQLYKEETQSSNNYYYIINSLPSGKKLEINKTYTYTITARDHYLNNKTSKQKQIFLKEPTEKQLLNTVSGQSLSPFLNLASGFFSTGICTNSYHRIVKYENNTIKSWRAKGPLGTNSIITFNKLGTGSLKITNLIPYPNMLDPETKEQLYKIKGIPNVVCDEQPSTYGKVCATTLGMIKQLYNMSSKVLVPENKKLVINQAFRTKEIQENFWNNFNQDSSNVCNPYKRGRLCPRMLAGIINVDIYDSKGHLLSVDEQEKLMCDFGFVRFTGEKGHFEYGTWRWKEAMIKRKLGIKACSYS